MNLSSNAEPIRPSAIQTLNSCGLFQARALRGQSAATLHSESVVEVAYLLPSAAFSQFTITFSAGSSLAMRFETGCTAMVRQTRTLPSFEQ